MKKFRDFLSRPSVTVALLALALVLLGGSTLGGARAALTVESQDYNSRITTNSIDVGLVENGTLVRDNKLVLLGQEKLAVGKTYSESLAVRNTGEYEEYVRVTVYKYWLDEKGNKYPDMDSEWIKLNFAKNSGWTIDGDSTTEERTVLYYASPLASGATSNAFLESFFIDKGAGRLVTQTEGNVIHTTYVYNGKSFCLDVYVDGVQTHSADKAKLSAWGVNK